MTRFIPTFSATVIQLQNSILSISTYVNSLNKCKLALERCPYTYKDFAAILSEIQSTLSQFYTTKCSNLNSFISKLDHQIGDILQRRMNDALKTWIIAFDHRQHENEYGEMEERELTEEERSTVAEVTVYDEVMKITCDHQVEYIIDISSFTL